MSHSSGYGVQVSAAELARRRGVAESQGRCSQLRRNAIEAARAAVASGAAFLEVPDEPSIRADSTADEAAATALKYERRVQRVLEQVSAARTKAVLAAFDQEVPPSIAGTISITWKHRTEAESGTPAAAGSVGENAEEPNLRARTMIASLAELDDPLLREELCRRITATLGASDAPQRLRRIFSDVDQAYRDQARVSAIRHEASELIATLRTYEIPSALRAREALTSATTREELKAGAELARTAREEAETREQEEFVVEQTAEVLRELGYDVGESFVETAEQGGLAVATIEKLGDYGLQVRIIDGGKRVITNTVALDAHTTHAADVAAEEHVCSDLATIAERLGKRGVRLDRYFESKPGELEIERRLDIATVRAKRLVRRAKATEAMEAHE